MELRNVALWDNWRVFATCDGVSIGKADMTPDGYYVDRDKVPPELEPAVRELEEGPGSAGPLERGECRGIDFSYPTPLQITHARGGLPPYRPRPRY